MNIERGIFKVLDTKKKYSHLYYFQSWYSPIFIKSRSENDNNYSTCITFQIRKDEKEDTHALLANIFKPTVLDSHELLIHAQNLNYDFTNHELKKGDSLINQKCVIIPADHHVNNLFANHLRVEKVPVQRFYLENNGTDLEGLIHQAIKLVKEKKFFILPKPKVENTLRQIDKDFLNMVCTYPDPESYALCYAWAQGLIYASKFLHAFENQKHKKADKGKRFNHGYGIEKI